MAGLTKRAEEACKRALHRLGFVTRYGLLLQPGENKEVAGWLGLLIAKREAPKAVLIAPNVGVRHLRLEAAILRTNDDKNKPIAALVKQLGYLMPEGWYKEWRFPADGDLDAVAEDLAQAVATYGQPFIDKYSNWEMFSRDAEADPVTLLGPNWREELPLILAINGERQPAEEIVQAELESVGDKDDSYSNFYRDTFAARFAEMTFEIGARLQQSPWFSWRRKP